MKRLFACPNRIDPALIRENRKKLGLSQAEFANLMGCSKPTVVRWENSKEPVEGPIAFAIYVLMMREDLADQIVLPKMKYRLRINYMYKEQLCTRIEVDEQTEKIEIENYNDHVMFRAFGRNTAPTYQDFQDFLESRCFPRTRDKMKAILEDLNLPFYDPLMIIEKTQGRMAEDDFWLDVERR